jgi:hypothetical protein
VTSSSTRVLSPTAILGYGFPLQSFQQGLKRHPHVIAVDAGSTDPGPYYLGSGDSFTDRSAVKRDLRLLLGAARSERIPFLIGTAGGSGAEPHLQRDLDLLLEVARELELHFRLAVIHADVDKARVKQDLSAGRIQGCGRVPGLTEAAIDASVRIVGQMGHEPFVQAVGSGADVVLAGRAYDLPSRSSGAASAVRPSTSARSSSAERSPQVRAAGVTVCSAGWTANRSKSSP